MAKNYNFLNMGKITLVLFIALFIAYLTYDKHSFLNSKIEPRVGSERAITVQTDNSLKDSIVKYGMGFLGTPYVSAGCGIDGFDCSGFVYFVFQHFNIEVPRSSSGFDGFGKEISIENLQKGDILLFLSPTRNVIGHVGIVSNPNGKKSDFIHASSGGEMQVKISSLASKGYTRRFVKAIRVID